MDLAKSWTAVIIVYLLAGLFTAVGAVVSGAQAEDFEGTAGVLLWTALPSLLTFLIATSLAAVVHPAPERDRALRHALAVFSAPAVLMSAGVIVGFLQSRPAAVVVAAFIASAIGTAGGWAIAAGRRRGRRRSRRTAVGEYL